MITTQESAKIVKEIGTKFGSGEKDTGNPCVQVALLTTRINNLAGHFANHKKDYHSNRGLMKMIGQRKRLLAYVQKKDNDKYQKLIKELGLRK